MMSPADRSNATVMAQDLTSAHASASGVASTSNSHSYHDTPAAIRDLPNMDWKVDLVRLAKTAELRKNALSLQLHTAQILAAHASMQQRKLAMEDLKEQKNKLDSERMRLLEALRKVNEDRDAADMLDITLNRDHQELQQKIDSLLEGDYARTKAQVDTLRQEMGQEPTPSIQTIIDEKSAQLLQNIRLTGEKRRAEQHPEMDNEGGTKRRRGGRVKGSKNKKTLEREAAAAAASTHAGSPPSSPEP